ncbi:FHA domain-containing protein [Ruminococcaceae bacterium YRB3002]|nr:FHA domain-containing protein [Ruminococcaceae bacterium YRB3002]
MMIRKGPYGQFAVEEVEAGTGITVYAIEIIDSGMLRCYLPVYINKTCDGTELAYEYSGLLPVSTPAPVAGKNGKDGRSGKAVKSVLSARRINVGEALLSFIDCMDMLVNPSLISLDPDYVFTDSEGSSVRFCLRPTEADKPNRLSSIDSSNMERLLHTDFFREVLTEDEINSLVYYISDNDEEMFKETANNIINTPISKMANHTHLTGTRVSGSLITAIMSSALSLISQITSVNPLITYVLFITALTMLVLFLYRSYPDIIAVIHPDNKHSSEGRSQILFDDPGKNTLNCAFLESVNPVNGAVLKYAVYQDLTTIGSDRFLSDFFIDDHVISPIHAQIYLTQDTVYLSDCSQDGKTFIDDRALQPETKYEIKNGQKITFGNIDFKVKINA